MAVKKFLSLERLEEYNSLIKQEIAEGDASTKSYVDTELAKKANSSHTHDDRYYTESEVDTKISGVNSSISTHTGNSDIHVTTTNKSNWNSAYSHSTSAHAPSNAERNIVVGIQKNGTDLTVDSTTRKVNITVPTTAAEVGAAPSGHNHDSSYDTKGASDTALASAKEYTDSKTSGMATTTVVDNKISTHNTATTAHSDIRDLISELSTKVSKFLDVDDTTTDQLSEVLTLIENNKGTLESLTSSKVNVSDIVNNLTTASASKVLSANQGVVLKGLIDALQAELDSHTHAIADVSGLQSALDGKAASSHGTHVTYSDTAPVMDGSASVGSAATVARSDHKHPTDTSRASKTEFDTHVADTTKHITSTERTNWGTAYTHSQAAHAPSNAEKNQNAFSNVKVGSTTVAADTATDTLEIAAGTGISVAGDATNDKVTITNSGVIAVSTGSANGTISVNTNGTAADVAVKGLGSAAYTNSSAYATAGHTHTVDSALSSSSTNPVQNKVVNSAISTLTSTVSVNTSSIQTHTSSISALQTAVGEIQEITSEDIRSLFSN